MSKRMHEPSPAEKQSEKPKLLVIAGPNGSGKTTFTRQLLKHYWSDDSVFINPDNIAQQEFGGWNDHASILKAAECAAELREDCLRSGKSMVGGIPGTVYKTGELLRWHHPAHCS